MILGRVVGTVWATRKHHRLDRYKLVLVRPYGYYHPTHAAEQVVAVDTLDAGVGDDVIVCLGAPARASLGARHLPVDAAILGIVDRCQLQRAVFDGAAPALELIGGQTPAKVSWI